MDILSDIDLYKAFFQSNSSYYIDKVNRYKEGQKFTFNIAAFFLGFLWMTYRKMYLEAFCILLIIIVEGMIEDAMLMNFFPDSRQAISLLVTLLFSIAMGFAGNYLYIRKAERTIRKAIAQESSQLTAEEYLQRKGGTSWLVASILLVLVLTWVILVTVLPH